MTDQTLERSIALLQQVARDHAPAVFASSLGLEDMVLLDLINRHARSIKVFTIDTGRLPPDTLDLLARAEAHYRMRIAVYAPDHRALEAYVRVNGINGFRDSIIQRKDCCAVRKVEPLGRALQGQRAWVTGMRRDQAPSRNDARDREFDAARGLHKFNPLIDWSLGQVRTYIKAHDVPYNPLHDQGYPSLGCAPCTRAIGPDEDVRAGRWWWEATEHKECGLHIASAHTASTEASLAGNAPGPVASVA